MNKHSVIGLSFYTLGAWYRSPPRNKRGACLRPPPASIGSPVQSTQLIWGAETTSPFPFFFLPWMLWPGFVRSFVATPLCPLLGRRSLLVPQMEQGFIKLNESPRLASQKQEPTFIRRRRLQRVHRRQGRQALNKPRWWSCLCSKRQFRTVLIAVVFLELGEKSDCWQFHCRPEFVGSAFLYTVHIMEAIARIVVSIMTVGVRSRAWARSAALKMMSTVHSAAWQMMHT
jgi:hypothetical protein